MCLSLLQGSNCLLPRDRWKVVQEFLEGVPSFKIIDKRLNRHPRTDENGSTAQDVGISVNDR